MALVFSSLFKTIIVFGKAFWEGIKSGSLEGSQKEILAISNCCLEVLNSFLTIFWLFGYLKTIFGPLKRTLSPLPDINHSTLPSYFNPKVKGSLITRFSPNAQQTVSVKFELRPFQF